jgi:hypothetical protein
VGVPIANAAMIIEAQLILRPGTLGNRLNR